MNNNQPPYKHFHPVEAMENILVEFDDFYFYKRTTHHAVMKKVKDYYYLHHTGLTYDEWCKEQKKKGSKKEITPEE